MSKSSRAHLSCLFATVFATTVFGNCSAGSRTAGGAVVKPEFDAGGIHVEYRDNETQPFVSVLLGGKAGYSATVSVLVGMGDDFTSTNVFNAVKSGDRPGAFAFIYPSPGETFKIKVIASAAGADDTVVTKEVTVPTDQGLVVPAHVGKGGGAGVIHVRVGAHGRNDGSCWTDAYTDFRAAIKLLAADTNELWFAGDEMVGATAKTISPVANAVLRGGFAGVENTPSGRVKDAKSQLDGQNLYDCLKFDNAKGKGVVVDGFFFTRGRSHGLVKTGAGDITVTNCLFDANGLAVASTAGRAMSISDTAGEARAEVVDCRIRNHREKVGSTVGNAGAVYLEGLASARLSDCIFANNGLAVGTTPYWDLVGRQGMWGVALAVKDTPVLVERCEFRANVAPSVEINGFCSGGTVALRGDCGGSVFRNCAWVGNENLFAKRLANDCENRDAGALVVKLAGAKQTVTVENCTFAGNLYEGPESTAGLNARAGTVNVLNSIFAGNLCGTAKKRFCPSDVRVSEGASVNVSYTIFGGKTNRLADVGGTLNVGAGCMDADPLFVTRTNTYLTCLSTFQGGIYYAEASTNALLGADIHVTKRSPAIDAGAPRSAYSREPKPNGCRVNLGAYGNTAEAASTKAAQKKGMLPDVFIMGDSISLGYLPFVQTKLSKEAKVTSAGVDCGSSRQFLAKMRDWLGDRHYDVIHLNFGIWDNHYVRGDGSAECCYSGSEVSNELSPIAKGMSIRDLGFHIRTPVDTYKKNLRAILAFVKTHADRVVFGLTTPLTGMQGDDRCGRIRCYNEIAASVCVDMNVDVDDLYAVGELYLDEQKDGCHFGDAGYSALADAVVKSIRAAL